MDAALAYKHQNPQESVAKVAERFNIASSTLHDHLTGRHSDRSTSMAGKLSTPQQLALIDKINGYARRGTHLAPGHIVQLAESLSGGEIQGGWVSRFLKRHKAKLSSRYLQVQEVSRIKADTPETRRMFYCLVRPTLPIFTYENADFRCGMCSKMADIRIETYITWMRPHSSSLPTGTPQSWPTWRAHQVTESTSQQLSYYGHRYHFYL